MGHQISNLTRKHGEFDSRHPLKMTDEEKINKAVDEFSEAMKAKLHKKRIKDGFSGWDTIETPVLLNMASEHLHRASNGDSHQFVDVANFMLFVWHNEFGE